MQKVFKILTLTFFIFSAAVYSSILEQKKFPTHLRWLVSSAKGQVNITQKGSTLLMKTLDAGLFASIQKDLISLQTETSYIKSASFNAKGLPNSAAKITVTLKDNSIELFSFYKDATKKYIVDFWINEDLVAKKATASTPVIKNNILAPKVAKVVKTKKIKRKKVKKVAKRVARKKTIRDFRYGSSFVWNLEAILPTLRKDVNLLLKAPNFLYQIKDRNFSKSEREAHMQLSINFYKKSKWGLMTKSISLYEAKYREDENSEINDFMKAVSLIKNQINPKVSTTELRKKGTFQAALNLLTNINAKTQSYELKKATTRYLLQDALDKNDYIKSLTMGKRLYVLATEQLDDEFIIYSSKVILSSLAKLKQVNKINEFLANKAVIRLLPKQVGFAYKSFVYLSSSKESKLTKAFEAKAAAMTRPIEPTIIFNVAEAYFRNAQYKKSIKLYDSYLADYAHLKGSSQARIRLALSYDLLEKNYKEVSELYKSAINKSSDVQARYEAKIRYVGHLVLRKIKLSEKDLEALVFLDQDEEEKKLLNKNLNKLLWLTRMRSFIVKEKYNEALAYLSSIPLVTLPSIERNVFTADGAEVVLGVIKKAYLEQNYAKSIKVWNIYKAKYIEKVARSPYLRFLVTDSYMKLGLNKSFNDSLAKLSLMGQKAERSYPRWVPLHKKINSKDFLIDVKIAKLVKDKMWSKLDKYLETVKRNKNINYNFYKGLVSYKRGFYNKAVGSYEKVIITPSLTNTLSPLENKSMLSNYIESLYEAVEPKRFRKNVKAILADLRQADDLKNPLLERGEYLIVESLFDNQSGFTELKMKSDDFLREFKRSSYTARVKYISAITHLKTKETNKGKVILEELLKEKDTPEYLKGLARSELTGLVLENKKL